MQKHRHVIELDADHGHGGAYRKVVNVTWESAPVVELPKLAACSYFRKLTRVRIKLRGTGTDVLLRRGLLFFVVPLRINLRDVLRAKF